ncbi:general secretion pathway protein GspB [Marinobacter caseinilyticus]|uniref:general secretion pathway protein GspB n=1 Tax=Marinobacter caseinilyticus TaxID=2692195 RepID=UPI001F1DD3D1|nr:general secretion pathway protein GspB [Marinobacter caseinilyticus]
MTMKIAFVLPVLFLAVLAPASALEDPTRPADFKAPVQATAVRPFTLNSIVVGSAKRVAVIDGVVRREGDVFDGARLVRVESDKVILRSQGRTLILNWVMPPSVRVSR